MIALKVSHLSYSYDSYRMFPSHHLAMHHEVKVKDTLHDILPSGLITLALAR
jgi:hypothetical protein